MSICDVSACRETVSVARDRAESNARAFISADGRRLAVAADSPVVSVWDPDTGQVVAELRTHRARVMAVAFHPRGDRLLTASPVVASQRRTRPSQAPEASWSQAPEAIWRPSAVYASG